MENFRGKWRKLSTRRRSCIALLILLLATVPTIVALSKYYISLRSTGEVKSTGLTVVQRHIRLDSFSPPTNIEIFVDDLVANNSYGTNNVICIYANDPIEHVVAYGYNFSKTSGTWDGWTFDQLKTLIDRFHYHGWKVVHETTSEAWDHTGGVYVRTKHPELTFTNALGQRHGIDFTSWYGEFPYNWFARYATDDPYLNISAGTRLMDVYAERFKQQFQDGLAWDGWFGTDGWNGRCVTNNIYFGLFQSSPTPAPEDYYSFSLAETDDWANWTKVTLPANWTSMDATTRASWIGSNAPRDWFEFWNENQAKLYSLIRTKAREANPDFFMISSVDISSDWNGILGPKGLLNVTTLMRFNAIDHFYVDTERFTPELPKYQAYAIGLLRSKNPNAHPIIGLLTRQWGTKFDIWIAKQAYLAQAQSYVWYNGSRYRAADPSWVMYQYPDEADRSDLKKLFDWIKSMLNVFAAEDLTPIYLGPTYVIPSMWWTPSPPWYSLNYVFAQWVDALTDVKNHPERINASMQSLFIDMIQLQDAYESQILGTQPTILGMFENGTLNIIAYSTGYRPVFGGVWGGQIGGPEEMAARDAFHMGTESLGSSKKFFVISEITDPYAKWIASGFENTTYDVGGMGNYLAGKGFVPIANFTDGRVALGIYYNSTSGSRFVYGRLLENASLQSMLNRAIRWASKFPMISSEPLLDFKVFKLNDGTILIPMMNRKNLSGRDVSWPGEDISATLRINRTALGLGNPEGYVMYWKSSSANITTISNWGDVPITLGGMADILVIAPKYGISQLSVISFNLLSVSVLLADRLITFGTYNVRRSAMYC